MKYKREDTKNDVWYKTHYQSVLSFLRLTNARSHQRNLKKFKLLFPFYSHRVQVERT